MGAKVKTSGSKYAEDFAATIISMLEQGVAPWQKPWRAGELHSPYNPVSGTVYKGINRVLLAARGFDDPRWLSLKQANDQGWRVKQGSKAQVVQHWQWTKKEQARDEDGQLQYDDLGKPLMVEVRLERPRVRYFQVFHASQVQTLAGENPPAYTPEKVEWDPHERAEAILQNSGASIFHDQGNNAYYSLRQDEIHLPPREHFPSAGIYYPVALHELGHWTRHPERLDRENGPFGSPSYAREELRAEIASWMLAQDLGLAFDPGHHASYVQDWIKSLQEDPHEIVRAARDAEKITQYLMKMELGLDQGEPFGFTDLPPGAELPAAVELPLVAALAAQSEVKALDLTLAAKVWLQVPYGEKEPAKKAGARWDREAKSWFAPAGADLEPLTRWLSVQALEPTPVLSPAEEFKQTLTEAGLIIDGNPVLDGRIHRVPVIDAPAKTKAGAGGGAYCADLTGRANGWFKNHQSHQQGRWLYSGQMLNAAQKAALQVEAAQRRAEAKPTNQFPGPPIPEQQPQKQPGPQPATLSL